MIEGDQNQRDQTKFGDRTADVRTHDQNLKYLHATSNLILMYFNGTSVLSWIE